MPKYSEKLTRQEYDALVKQYPEWMENNWDKLDREWSLSGVRVSGDPNIMDDLYTLYRNVRWK